LHAKHEADWGALGGRLPHAKENRSHAHCRYHKQFTTVLYVTRYLADKAEAPSAGGYWELGAGQCRIQAVREQHIISLTEVPPARRADPTNKS
jgi:hypothetical protein